MSAQRIPGYDLHEPIGVGAMGTVYRATTRKGETRAVKILDENWRDDPDAVHRFDREGKLSVGLDHPHICRVFRHGQKGEVHFIEMELVGQGLSVKSELDVMTPDGLDIDRAIEIFLQTAQAVAFLHANQVVHRDIKPENLLVTADGSVKLADFGLARHTNRDAVIKGHGVGTPHYMAPEMFDEPTVTPNTDIFALGVMGYECLTGTLPFPGDTVKAVRAAHRRGPAPSVASVRPEAPPELAELIDAMIHPDRAVRPATMEIVIKRLAALSSAAPLRRRRFPTIRENEKRTKQLAREALFVTGEIPAELVPPVNRKQAAILLGLAVATIAALVVYAVLMLGRS